MDEFSDFQMAVQLPPPQNSRPPYKNGMSPGKGLGTLRFPDSSPVHSFSSHHSTNSNSKAEFLRSQLIPPPAPPPSQQKLVTNVGSRLANYDLGLSVPSTGQGSNSNGFLGNGGDCSNGSSFGLDFSRTINHPTRNNNQDLLIGEEDKYSALRMLIETDIDSTTSVFESPPQTAPSQQSEPQVQLQFFPNNTTTSSIPSNDMPAMVQPFNSNINSNIVLEDLHQINHSSSIPGKYNLTSALQLSPKKNESPSGITDDSSDFGDFQSFTGFTVSNMEPSTDQNVELDSFSDHSQQQPVSFPMIPSTLPSLQKLEFTSGLNLSNCENGTSDSDAEFGDFVCVEPTSNDHPPKETIPTSKMNHWNHPNIDLPSLPTSFPTPSCDIKGTYQDGGIEQPNFESFKKEVDQYQTSPDVLVKHTTTTTTITNENFFHDDITNVVLGQGLDWETSAVGIDAMKTANTAPPPIFHNSTLTPSSFIRTSLIRNDEVTDIDPAKWNQSVIMADEGSSENAALDFNSKDLPCLNGKSKFLDVSPETRSIASLDLGSYVTVDYPENNGGNTHLNNNNISNSSNNHNGKIFTDQTIHHQTYAKNSTEATSTTPPIPLLHPEEPTIFDELDKYQCFREECENEKERYCVEWSRCLESCRMLISRAFSVFNGVSTSEVIREVVSDEKGYTYVMNIFEIYRVSQRIQKSAERLGIQSKLRGVTLEINNLWETLSAFLLGSCVSTEICQDVFDDECIESGNDVGPSCGVCLCTVDVTQSTQFLDYGGKIYHCNCANFWVNQVDAILPSLSYVPSGISGSRQIR